jgi:hypothetical protein
VVDPHTYWRVAKVQILDDFRLKVTFLDGLTGEVDMSVRVHSPSAGVFAALSDPAHFASVFIELGVVTWPGEIDLAPDAMYEAIKKSGVWKLS